MLGVRDVDTIVTIRELPPFLQRASKDVAKMIGTLDEQILMVLSAVWELRDEVPHCCRSFALRARAYRTFE